ncbi:hypothetical protein QFZ54_002973 [Sphingomonas faeni]|nr:hypothetical protein [Sphingomonas faeni]
MDRTPGKWNAKEGSAGQRVVQPDGEEASSDRVSGEVSNPLSTWAAVWVVRSGLAGAVDPAISAIRFGLSSAAGISPPDEVVASWHDPAARDRRGTWDRVRRPSRTRARLPPRQSK